MTKFLPALFVCGLLAGSVALPRLVAAGTELTAVGARDAAGARVDDYKIVDGTGSTRAQGRFEKGKMEGKWSFFDSRQVKVAEITYHQGVPSGPYKTYFGSKANPEAAGKLESEGSLQDGRVTGRHVGYDPSGKVFTDAVMEAGKANHVTVGTREQAAETSGSDEQFVRALDEVIRPALR